MVTVFMFTGGRGPKCIKTYAFTNVNVNVWTGPETGSGCTTMMHRTLMPFCISHSREIRKRAFPFILPNNQKENVLTRQIGDMKKKANE